MTLQETTIPAIPYRDFVGKFLTLALTVSGAVALLFTLLGAAGLVNVNINTDSTQLSGLGAVLIVSAGFVVISAVVGWLVAALSYHWIYPASTH